MRLGKQAGPGRWRLGPAGRGPSSERRGQSRKAVWRGSPSRVCLGEASACKGEEAPAPCGHTPLGRSSDPLLQKGKPSPGAGTACGRHIAAGSGVWSHRPPSLVPFPAPSPSVPEPCTRPPWLEHSVLTNVVVSASFSDWGSLPPLPSFRGLDIFLWVGQVQGCVCGLRFPAQCFEFSFVSPRGPDG